MQEAPPLCEVPKIRFQGYQDAQLKNKLCILIFETVEPTLASNSEPSSSQVLRLQTYFTMSSDTYYTRCGGRDRQSFVSWRPAWTTLEISCQPGLYSKSIVSKYINNIYEFQYNVNTCVFKFEHCLLQPRKVRVNSNL